MAARFFGQFLLQRGVVGVNDLLRGLEYQRSREVDLADLAVRDGLISEADVSAILKETKRRGASFAEIARSRGALDDQQLSDLAATQQREQVRLGDALIAVGAIDEAVRDRELAVFLEENDQARANLEEAKRALGWGADPAVASIVETTATVLLRVGNERSKVGAIARSDALPGGAVRVEAGLRGDWNCDYILATSTDVGRRIAASLRDEPAEAVADDALSDALCTFVEAALWEACHALQDLGHSCEVSTPYPVPRESQTSTADREGWIVKLTLPDSAVDFAVIPRSS